MREINLLPPLRKRQLRRQHWIALTQSALQSATLGLTLITVVGIFVIFIVWILSVAAARTSDIELASRIKEYQKLREATTEHNALFEQVALIGRERIVWSTVVSSVLAALPPGVNLHDMIGNAQYESTGGAAPSLVITGHAASRSVLTVLGDRLRQLKNVTGVISPTSDLLERENPDFRFEIQFKHN
jgi:hypothetical protein